MKNIGVIISFVQLYAFLQFWYVIVGSGKCTNLPHNYWVKYSVLYKQTPFVFKIYNQINNQTFIKLFGTPIQIRMKNDIQNSKTSKKVIIKSMRINKICIQCVQTGSK